MSHSSSASGNMPIGGVSITTKSSLRRRSMLRRIVSDERSSVQRSSLYCEKSIMTFVSTSYLAQVFSASTENGFASILLNGSGLLQRPPNSSVWLGLRRSASISATL